MSKNYKEGTKMENEKPLDQFGEAMEDVFEDPDAYPDKVTYLALSEEEKKRLLTPKRIQLLKTIRNNGGLSVSELAGEVGRDIGAVSRDLKVLSDHEVIELSRSGHRKEAAVAASHIVIPLGSKEAQPKSSVG